MSLRHWVPQILALLLHKAVFLSLGCKHPQGMLGKSSVKCRSKFKDREDTYEVSFQKELFILV